MIRGRSRAALAGRIRAAVAPGPRHGCRAQDLQPIPKLAARVTDLTGTLTAEQQAALEQKLAAFESAKGTQMAVLIVPTTQPEEIEQYSIRVVDQWKLGRNKVDDGALLLVAKNDRALRIEVGHGLEGVLTDATSNRIISETIAPLFQRGRLLRRHRRRPRPDDQARSTASRCRRRSRPGRGGTAAAREPSRSCCSWSCSASVLLRRLFGRTVGATLTGLGAGGLVYLGGYALALAGRARPSVGFLFTLLMGFAGSGSGWTSRGRRLWRGLRRWAWRGVRRRRVRRRRRLQRRRRRLQWRRRLGQLVRRCNRETRPHPPPHLHHALRHAPALPAAVRDAIEKAIGECEGRHGGEIRFVVETRLRCP